MVPRVGRAAATWLLPGDDAVTVSLFLRRRDESADALVRYVEADDVARVMEVYETTDNRVARWSEVVLNYLSERPMDALGDPTEASDYERLVHETNATRR